MGAEARGNVMAAGKAAGLVDVKVIGFSPSHTAEKFVIPISARPRSSSPRSSKSSVPESPSLRATTSDSLIPQILEFAL
jgi:hypothetical protein